MQNEPEEAPEDEPPQAGDMASQLSAAGQPDDEDLPDDGEISLEELSQSYANVLQSDSEPETDDEEPDDGEADGSHKLQVFDPAEDEEEENATCPITPQSIIESVLMIGRSDSGTISAAEIASLMRGVDSGEVDNLVAVLNRDYASQGRALRIEQVGSGYKMAISTEMHPVRERFYGRVRDVRLNQASIDCLALVAYQPGIKRKKIEEQRSQPSGGVLNQLVRRELLEIRREGTGKSAESYYYPTERLLRLSGLETLDDLPQVEDLD